MIYEGVKMKELFEESLIGKMRLRNRFIRSSTWEGMAGEDGEATDGLVEFYGRLARGGVGLILTGHAYVTKRGKANSRQLGIYDDCLIPSLKRLTDAVHSEGGKIAVQLGHAGSQGNFDTGVPPHAPSAVTERATGKMPVEMTVDDISALVGEYAEASRRAMEAGFDAVEIHAAHGYLLTQFLSQYSNRRKDGYGGNIKNRSRVVFEVFDAVKNSVGSNLPVMIKFNCADFDGVESQPDDFIRVCRELSDAGIDAIELSGGVAAAKGFSSARTGIDSPDKEAYFRDSLRELRPYVKCPVSLVGGIRSLEVIDDLYRNGMAQFFSMARPMISEPGLVKRWVSGDTRRARCISCNKCFKSAVEGNLRCITLDEHAEKNSWNLDMVK